MPTRPPELMRYLSTLDQKLSESPGDEELAEIRNWISELHALEMGVAEGPKIKVGDYIQTDFEELLRSQGITSGRVCELGGPANSFGAKMPSFQFTYLSLFPAPEYDVVVADATQCDHLEAEQFDVIFSKSVFEHIAKPWLAAPNLTRLLKPGGVMYHTAPFSYFYHGAPGDFWRYTPDALRLLFSDLRPLRSEFYGHNRRRDNRGSAANPVDRDGGPAFAVDSFGGWRENWTAVYAGVKDPTYVDGVMERAKMQTVVNLMRQLRMADMPARAAARELRKTLRHARVTRDCEVSRCEEGESNFDYDVKAILELWWGRGKTAPSPNSLRWVMASRLGLG